MRGVVKALSRARLDPEMRRKLERASALLNPPDQEPDLDLEFLLSSDAFEFYDDEDSPDGIRAFHRQHLENSFRNRSGLEG